MVEWCMTVIPTLPSGWEKNDTPSITAFLRSSPGKTYAANLGLRTTGLYPFTSLTLIVEQRKVAADKAVTVVVTDTVACQLTDRKGNAKQERESAIKCD